MRTVTGFIQDLKGIDHWEVDLQNPEKILTVKGDTITAQAVIEAVEEAGFDIELKNAELVQ